MEPIELVVTGITVVDKLVLRFSQALPERGVAWRDYEKLDEESKKLVDETIPEDNTNGKPKAKFAKEYQIHFEDVENGRKYLYDVKIRCFENGKPWTQSKALLDQVGATGTVEEAFPIDTMFKATLTRKEGEKFWHINPVTLARV